MESAIQDLVNMGDFESLYEVMTEHDDFIYCLDAAEGLVMLGDERGIEFLLDAVQSDDEDIRDVAQEILDTPAVRRKREEFEGPIAEERKKQREAAFETAKKRIADGKKVFIYKTVFLTPNHFLSNDPSDEGDSVEALNEFGFEGWEVAAFFPLPTRRESHGSPILGGATGITLSGKLTGGYFYYRRKSSHHSASHQTGWFVPFNGENLQV